MKEPSANGAEPIQPAAERIVRSARELFFAEGFSTVTTDRLCKAAAVSKSSLYKYFGSMSGVLSAVVRIEGNALRDGVLSEPRTAAEFWSSLSSYGVNLLILLNRHETINFDRLMHEESRRHPEIARLFYDMTYGRCHFDLTGMIDFGKREGFITKPQPSEQLADHLYCIWESLAFVKARLGLTQTPYATPMAHSREGLEALFAECMF